MRLIGRDKIQIGIVTLAEALSAAEEAELDLVEISPHAEPPVCLIVDYGKHVFQQNKKRSTGTRKQHSHLKEIKFRPGTEEGDYQIKLRNLKRFLGHGDRTKVTLWFRGREMIYREAGSKLLQRIEADLQDVGKVEQQPRFEGRRVSMVLAPQK